MEGVWSCARHWRTKRTARTVYEALLSDWSEEDLRQGAFFAARIIETLEHRTSNPPARNR